MEGKKPENRKICKIQTEKNCSKCKKDTLKDETEKKNLIETIEKVGENLKDSFSA